MLEQAIVDANTLREAAIKSAETNLVEKYSDHIKEAVENLLSEQEDPLAALLGGGPPPDMGMPMPPTMPPGPMGAPDAAMENVPLGATQGEKLCPCPDEEEIIVIPLDDLVRQEEDIAPPDATAMGMPIGPDMGMPMPPMPEEEPVMMAENYLHSLTEGLKVDVSPDSVRPGWAGTPAATRKEAEELALAREQDDEESEELEELRAAVEKLEESNELYETYLYKAKEKIDFYKNKLEETNNKLEETNNNLKAYYDKLEETKEVAYTLHGKVQESNLTNAKLLYTNKVLLNNSLNERQKTQIVENLTTAKNVEDTKTIYETLQSAVGSTVKTTKRQPQSLSEAVRRSSTTMLPRHKEEAKNLSVSDRWKTLAGIKD